MKPIPATLILLLAGTTVGGALLAWRQYGELVELRASALNRAERAELQKRIWDLEKQNRELQERPAATRSREGGADAATAGEDEPGRGERFGRVGPGGRGDPFGKQAAAMRDLMSRPEVQALVNQQQRSAIEGRYAALFRNLNLSPEQASRLTALLADRGTTMQDLFSAAREQGIDPRSNPEAFRKLMTDAQNQINDSIKAVIGDQGFAQLTNYEQTQPQRSLVNDLQQRLSYTSSPLTPAQAEQLIQILAANAPQRSAATAGATLVAPAEAANTMVFRSTSGGPGRGPEGATTFSVTGGPGVGAVIGAVEGLRIGGASVTDTAVSQAQGILSASQLAALQQIQQQQQSQQQLRDLMIETMRSVAPSGGEGAPPPPRKRGGG